ncbi:MAG: hypothetical protein MJA83_02850 [Gammaproteobacteria bacterium]|nr:hypothetical protein [Gammaproteobacteria bacterium]
MAEIFKINDILNNPEYLLHGINPHRSELIFLEVTKDTYLKSSFLDNRITHSKQRIHGFDISEIADAVQQLPVRSAPMHFIFHSAFCCSTLMARSLQFEGLVMSLREPTAITNLADGKRIQMTRGQYDKSRWLGVLKLTLRLLNKVYDPKEKVLIKPTNVANNLIDDVLSVDGNAKALFMTCDLETFIVSNLKKQEEAVKKIPLFARFFTMDCDYLQHFPEIELPELDFLQRVVLVWHVQRYIFMQLLEKWGAARLRTLDAEQLLQNPEAALVGASDLFGLDIPPDKLAEVANGPVWKTHAKHTDNEYNTEMRQAENREIMERNKDAIDGAMRWSDYLQERLTVPKELPLPLLAG